MTSEEGPQWSPRRATDGLDWRPTAPDERRQAPAEVSPPPPPVRERPRHSWGPAAWAGAGAVIGGILTALAIALVTSQDQTAAPAPGGTGGTPQSVTIRYDDAIVQAAARAHPAVVRIESTRRVQGGIEQDVGSGVIIDDQGHILTNAHVVLGTETLKVFLEDGTERPAIMVGHDAPFNDIAVLQVGPGGISPIEIGDSSALLLGQTVVVIGNPLAEFYGSVTVGVVSGLSRRRIIDGVRQDDLIQTDAAVNNGNSGGAMVNLQGQLVGIPTLVIRAARNTQAVEGISFAIPGNRAMDVAKKIIESNGPPPRPAMGVDHLDITAEVISRFPRLAADEGALIVAVGPGGPADAAGILPGDIIIRVGDQAVDRENPFLNALASRQPGETVRVVLNRNGRIIETDVRLAKRS